MENRRAHRKNNTHKVYKTIKVKYDTHTKRSIRRYQQTTQQITRLAESTKFLERCKRSGLVPKFIIDATKNITYTINNNINNNKIPCKFKKVVSRYIENGQIKLLNLIIRIKHDLRRQKEKLKSRLKAEITLNLDPYHSTAFFESEDFLINNLSKKVRNTQIIKYENLREKEKEKYNIRAVPEYFCNTTSLDIPKDTQWLLSLGPKHVLPLEKEKFPLFKCIADGENIIQTVQNKERQEIERNNFTVLIQEYMKKSTHSFLDKFMCETLHSTKKFLKNNKQILILNADKGNVTVAMEKNDYTRKMQIIVNNISDYRVLKRDPTTKLQDKNNELVMKMFKNGHIEEKEKNFLISKVANPPRIYGLPKIHKDGIPLRPICSSIGSPSYNLCKYVVRILKNITKSSKYNVKDSTEFKEKVKDTYIYDDESLVSFDVVSLFPSIPVDAAIDIIASRWTDIKEHTCLTKELFMNILKFCVRDNRYFKYNDKIYEQRSGMPMGSPASPVIADIVLDELLTRFEMESKSKPRLLTKYVDDLFAIVKTSEMENMLKLLNTYYKSIRFTMEVEKNNRLPYLDTLIIKNNNKLYIDWYKKQTASGRLINYNSKHAPNTILNTAKNFIRRVLNISDKMFHNKNIAIIRKTLEQNSFPRSLINKLIHKHHTANANNNTTEKGDKIYKSMTYIPGVSERIKGSNLYDKEKYEIAFTYNNTLRPIYSNLKDKIPNHEKSNVVYKIPCNGDGSHVCEQVYVGTTKLKLKTRLSAHKSNIKLRNNNPENKTALAAHCKETGHYPDFENVTILEHEKHYNKRFILETLHILNTPNDIKMNFKSDVDHCAQTYRSLVLKQQHHAAVS
ncbi:uncharacterized protein [Eurosta solidaginis]|uniref:uncharacterized protein n=1 Tax=Eurosta solidaginis TaxID=178769 RepID=UPI0035306A39